MASKNHSKNDHAKPQSKGHAHTGAGVTPVVHDPVDAWHDHTHDQAPQSPHTDAANVTQVMSIGLILAVAVVLSAGAVLGFYKWYVAGQLSAEERVNPNIPNSRLAPPIAVRWETQDKLNALSSGAELSIPTEEGKPNRTVRLLKIDDAKAAVIREYAGRTSTAGQKPAPTPAPAKPVDEMKDEPSDAD